MPHLGRSASLTGYLDLARQAGLDPYRMCAAQGLPAACLTDPDLKVPAEAMAALLEASAARAGAEDFGLRLAETRQLSNMGAVGLVAREQATVREALEILMRYAWVQSEALSVRLEEAGDLVILRPNFTLDGGVDARQASELTIGVMVRILRQWLGGDWRPEMIAFTHGPPASMSTHRRVLGVAPEFGAALTGVFVLARRLDTPIAGADPAAARQLERFLQQAAGGKRNDTAAAVRELILALLPTGACSADKVAAHMGVDRRTLHRRLTRQGLNFSRLLRETRSAAAMTYLSIEGRSLTEVAELVGYSSLSAFSRARRRRRPLKRRSAAAQPADAGFPTAASDS